MHHNSELTTQLKSTIINTTQMNWKRFGSVFHGQLVLDSLPYINDFLDNTLKIAHVVIEMRIEQKIS